mgnify:CR=1 FL=1
MDFDTRLNLALYQLIKLNITSIRIFFFLQDFKLIFKLVYLMILIDN